jgi:hypothetical protein
MEPRAEFVYEVCRLEAIASVRPIVPERWKDRAEDFKSQFIKTVDRLCAPGAPSTTPEAEHDSWVRAYEEMGWCYGPVRNREAKTHPDMVPFDDLDILEQEKDAVFLDVCILANKHVRNELERINDRVDGGD